jgi:hypothetical protein
VDLPNTLFFNAMVGRFHCLLSAVGELVIEKGHTMTNKTSTYQGLGKEKQNMFEYLIIKVL